MLESQLPKGMEKTMEKIAELEGLGVKPEMPTESEEVRVVRIAPVAYWTCKRDREDMYS